MGLVTSGMLFHASSAMFNHERLVWMMPALPILLLATVAGVNLASRHGYLHGSGIRYIAAQPLSIVAAALSLGAAAIHAVVVEEHLDEWLAEGVFFIAVAVFQLVWAVAYVWRPGRRLGLIGLAGNALVVGAWLMSRVVGLPVGPEPWTPVAFGLPDLIATAFAVGLIGVILRGTQRPLAVEKALVLTIFGVGSVAILTGFVLWGMAG